MRTKLNWAVGENGFRRVFAGVAVIALASCGGGGGGDDFLQADNCSPPAQISSTPPTNATAGVEYRYHANATYSCWLVPLIPLTCSGVNAVRLPAGATVSGTTVRWTPTTDLVNADMPFTIATPADICGNRATQSWAVHVHAQPVIESFASARAFIAPGESTMLTAVFRGNGRIEGIGPVTSSLPVATPPLHGNTLFTLIVTNDIGVAARHFLTVDVPKPLSGNATGPKVLLTSPANGESRVATRSAITATFSEYMDAATVTTATFLLRDGSNSPVGGTVTVSGQVATFVPTSSLGFLAQYTATIVQGVRDLAGNSMPVSYAWSFTTDAAPDTTPPTVNSTVPVNGAECVAPEGVRVTATFSEIISRNSVNESTAILRDDNQNPVPGFFANSNGGNVATFVPAMTLASARAYTAIMTTGITDLSGNRMTAEYSWTFTTAAPRLGTWQPGPFIGGRSEHTAVWTGSEMIVWGGSNDLGQTLNTGTRYDPALNISRPTSTIGAPAARPFHTSVWTGSEMIVWGGSLPLGASTGGRYNPATNTWQPTSTAGAPSARRFHTAVWTGSEMIVWGGQDQAALPTSTGARYNPVTDTWQPMTTSGAPSARYLHKAVWTGSELIVLGGSFEGNSPLDIGGRYDPATDTWQPLITSGAPAEMVVHTTAVWTGTEMAVWGNGGSLYNPQTQTWRPMTTTCAPRSSGHTAVWTGTEMLVWGGSELSNSGARYDPATDTWRLMSISSAPSGRIEHTAVWTGSEMIVSGGTNVTNGSFFRPRLGDIARYRP